MMLVLKQKLSRQFLDGPLIAEQKIRYEVWNYLQILPLTLRKNLSKLINFYSP